MDDENGSEKRFARTIQVDTRHCEDRTSNFPIWRHNMGPYSLARGPCEGRGDPRYIYSYSPACSYAPASTLSSPGAGLWCPLNVLQLPKKAKSPAGTTSYVLSPNIPPPPPTPPPPPPQICCRAPPLHCAPASSLTFEVPIKRQSSTCSSPLPAVPRPLSSQCPQNAPLAMSSAALVPVFQMPVHEHPLS